MRIRLTREHAVPEWRVLHIIDNHLARLLRRDPREQPQAARAVARRLDRAAHEWQKFRTPVPVEDLQHIVSGLIGQLQLVLGQQSQRLWIPPAVDEQRHERVGCHGIPLPFSQSGPGSIE